MDVSSIPRAAVGAIFETVYPHFPLTDELTKMTVPQNLSKNEQSLLEFLEVDENLITHIEKLTIKQSNCAEWQQQ